jgi:hypothetical protein
MSLLEIKKKDYLLTKNEISLIIETNDLENDNWKNKLILLLEKFISKMFLAYSSSNIKNEIITILNNYNNIVYYEEDIDNYNIIYLKKENSNTI